MEPGDLQLLIEKATAHLTGNPGLAERDALEPRQHTPSDPRLALIFASALRRRGQHHRALAILEPLARAHPDSAVTLYELGVVQGACGDTAAAIRSLRRAIVLNPLLPEAWRALGERMRRPRFQFMCSALGVEELGERIVQLLDR